MLEIKKTNANKKIIGIYIEDCPTETEDELASKEYYYLKYNFIKNNMALQVINYRKHNTGTSLKWSTSNIALAMFAKMGGIPWLIKSSNTDCLILGIGNAIERNATSGKITKFSAFTVCLDSSGRFKTLQVLAEDSNNNNYLQKLTDNLKQFLINFSKNTYKTCVLHLPSKIKQNEIKAISLALNQIKDINFIAIKINIKNKYFGFGDHNTLVPYESSYVQLSDSEFLVWFEGLQFGKEIVDKKLANPVHIKFLNLAGQIPIEEKSFLQDVLNLSGTNWRGFNAKSTPISIYYSYLIAKYNKAFQKITNYDESLISNDEPWFL
jgi:argonaute-like protein implicated in RNA metabolism and viral defense